MVVNNAIRILLSARKIDIAFELLESSNVAFIALLKPTSFVDTELLLRAQSQSPAMLVQCPARSTGSQCKSIQVSGGVQTFPP